MAAKTSDWRPGPTVCRCCLTEGCYKDISTEYFWMGKREVYAEMLSETLDVSISYSKSGGPNSNSRLICEPCIARLRDASDFKRQVLECEKTFMQHLDSGSVSAEKEDVLTLKEVKVELVKQEGKLSDDDDDFEERVDFVVENDDTDDDLDNEPLMKLATKVPKKEVELLDLLDNSEITVKRKSTSTKTKEPPAKKVKKREIVIKPSASKASASSDPQVVKKKKETNRMTIARRNAYTIVEYTTAYPFRLPESSIMCVFCCESFREPESFRDHMRVEHQEYRTTHAFQHVFLEYKLKVDITDLACRICGEAFRTLEDIARHLVEFHSKRIDFNYDLGLLPYRIENDRLSCPVCDENFSNLRTLSRHVQTHYLQYICEHCGKAYSTSNSLNCHVRNMCAKAGADVSQRRCRKCKAAVSSLEEHMRVSESCRQHICNVCGQRFGHWRIKQEHLKTAHGVPKRTYKCPECVEVYPSPCKLKEHFKLSHTDDYLTCAHCGIKFDTRNRLDRHMITHTGEKSFVCQICSKAFNKKSTLKTHMWIHSEVKKYQCKICEKAFNQKVCWKNHMKLRHPELYDPTC